jgi:hypothetical protein
MLPLMRRVRRNFGVLRECLFAEKAEEQIKLTTEKTLANV